MGNHCCKSTANPKEEMIINVSIQEKQESMQMAKKSSLQQSIKQQNSNNNEKQVEEPLLPVDDQQKIEYQKADMYNEYEQKSPQEPAQIIIPEFKQIQDKEESKVSNEKPQPKPQEQKQTTEKKSPNIGVNGQQIPLNKEKKIEKALLCEQTPKSDRQDNTEKLNSEGLLQRSNSKGTVVSKSMKIGVDLFVKLKKGSISKYYSTGQVLGQGAFGKVWKVTHKTTGLIRAMKQLKKSALIKEEEQKLFSEMNILKNLDHPHIVKLFELYQDNTSYYLITEYLSGGELFERIKKMNYFSERKAADFLRQILLAVVYCHEQKIVHRDLKPENIIFSSSDHDAALKVIDFGTSRKFDTKNMTKRLGTPYYIAPEVLHQNYNEKCDVWSCGIILYILLCGYPPFTGRSEKEILDKVKLGKFKYDPDDWDLISKEAKALINKMLTYDANNRISAKDALQDGWIQKYAPSQEINKKVLKNLSNFQAKSVFKQALLSYIVCQMSTQKEIEDLQKTFQSLDKNNDGLLSKEELVEGYTLVIKDKAKAEEEVSKILAQIDINQSEKVDFSEFLMAGMNQEKLISVKKVEQAFKIFDQDNDGYISRKEIELVMGELDEEQWKQFLGESDKNNDGKISFDEFKKLLLAKV